MQTGISWLDGYFALRRPKISAEGKATICVTSRASKKAGGLQPQCRAVGGGHIDDGIHTVDVAEEGQQEPEHLLILAQVLEGVADAHKALPDGVLLYLHIVDLLIASAAAAGWCPATTQR